MSIETFGAVRFPEDTGLHINMMPVVMGDWSTVPEAARKYVPMMEQCRFDPGGVVYLTAHESMVEAGHTQRRAGVHTDGTATSGWGGGGWGRSDGIYIASTDGACRAWGEPVISDDAHGAVDTPSQAAVALKANTLYRMGDRTPHESLPASTRGRRQFFRLVGPDIGAWWAMHSTANPGVRVPAHIPVLDHSKFDEGAG